MNFLRPLTSFPGGFEEKQANPIRFCQSAILDLVSNEILAACTPHSEREDANDIILKGDLRHILLIYACVKVGCAVSNSAEHNFI